jgi:RNA-directed DNA polymerase
MPVDLFKDLENELGITEEQIRRLIARSPHTYKLYKIPKNSGGFRTIAQPAKETKLIQWWLIKRLFIQLPVHDCATAYKVGASIRANADRHRNNQYFTKLDFKNFFPSITENDVVLHLSKHLSDELDEADIRSVARLSCIKLEADHERCLSIGAPSSPLLSNSIMYEFDCEVLRWCERNSIVYTRYADDLTFSSNEPKIASLIVPSIEKVVGQLNYPKLIINEKKTVHLSKKFQRRVTGIVINNAGELSLGRERKRAISSMIHRFKAGTLPEEEKYRLKGLLGFARDVEPSYLDSMRKKYGYELITLIIKLRKVS